MLNHDIGFLHHVGHVVRDLEQGLELYRRLGFRLAPPAYPALAPAPGEPPRPIGAANTHAEFRRNFVELATCVSGDRLPSGATLVPLQVPAAQLASFKALLERAAATLAACLSRFEGLHILALETTDPEAAAGRLRAAGVGHAGVATAQRWVDTEQGPRVERVRFLEVDGPGEVGTGRVPEGRIALAENPPAELLQAQRGTDHPNGAVDLVEVVLCVAAADLAATERRYQTYLARAARADGPARVFDLQGAQVTLVADEDLEALYPGERPAALPAFVGYAVAVRDLQATSALLRGRGFPLVSAGARGVFVPAQAALGAAVTFREAAQAGDPGRLRSP